MIFHTDQKKVSQVTRLMVFRFQTKYIFSRSCPRTTVIAIKNNDHNNLM